MNEASTRPEVSVEGSARFDLSPPRRFILPAILLLLSEQPGHGYGLLSELQTLRYGHVDRPAVYRALAILESDGLIEAWSAEAPTGQARRVYRITRRGERILRSWMSVVKEERDRLEQVLQRYQSTGTAEAALAEIGGLWGGTIGYGWSPVSSTTAGLHRVVPLEREGPDDARSVRHPDCASDTAASDPATADADPSTANPSTANPGGRRPAKSRKSELLSYRLDPGRSVALIEVRSTVGPLTFGATGVSGSIEAAVADGAILTDPPPAARVELAVANLSSGNRFYDAELLRRIDAHRYRLAELVLHDCGRRDGGLYQLNGEMTFHGITRAVDGSVIVESLSDTRLLISGEQVFDIRDFKVPSPTVMMLRIYPDVRVQLHAEAELIIPAT